MIRLYLLLILSGISFAISLEDALSIAKQNATKIRLSLLDVQKAQEQIRQARANILPQVSFSYSYTHLDKELAFGFTPRDRHSYSLSVSQTIFNLSTLRAIDTVRESLELQKLVYQDLLRDVEYQVKDLFYALLYKKEVVGVYRDDLKYWEENYRLTEEKYRAGIVPKVELLRSQAQLESARARLESATTDYKNSLESFRAFLRLDSITEPEGELNLKEFDIPTDAKQELYKNNSSLKVALKSLEVQEKRLDQLKALYYPELKAVATYQGNTARVGGSTQMVDGYTLGLSLNYNIFDGFLRESSLAQAQIELLKQREQLADLKFNLSAQLESVLNNLSSLKTQIKAQELSVKSAEESLRLSKERYKLGIATQLEVLDAVSNYNTALLNLYLLYYRYNSNLALLERLTR